MDRFDGTIEDLKLLVGQTQIKGKWKDLANNQYRFDAENGAILNWWNNKKKTILLQGPERSKNDFEKKLSMVQSASNDDVTANVLPIASATAAPAKISVVHGHDDASREQLERILLILGLEPFVLQNSSGGGMTIIESLERQIGKTPEAEFGIVLITPDDLGYAKRDGDKDLKPRARQNVVLEMSMLLSSLTRKRVAILVKGHIELPSDAQGIIYLHFNDHVKEVVPKLADRLREVGFNLEPSRITKAGY